MGSVDAGVRGWGGGKGVLGLVGVSEEVVVVGLLLVDLRCREDGSGRARIRLWGDDGSRYVSSRCSEIYIGITITAFEGEDGGWGRTCYVYATSIPSPGVEVTRKGRYQVTVKGSSATLLAMDCSSRRKSAAVQGFRGPLRSQWVA